MNTEETEPTVYKLKRINSSTDKDYPRALKIYLDNIDYNVITNTNEITHCIDSYNKLYPDAEFTVVGFYMNKVLIGFSQFIYFKKEKFMFIDYLVIEKIYRKNNTFYEFLAKIREYIDSVNYDLRYIVGEISLQGASEEKEYSPNTRNLIRLLKMNNFGTIEAPYYQPMLGVNNYESYLKAILMLYPVDEYRIIKKETFLMILKTVYFKHYENWYKLFLNDAEIREYSMHIHDLFREISEKIKSSTSIDLQSYNELMNEKTVNIPKKVPKKILYFLIGLILLTVLLSVVSFSLKSILKMDYKDQSSFLIFVSLTYLVILSFLSNKASTLLNKVVEKVIEKIT